MGMLKSLFWDEDGGRKKKSALLKREREREREWSQLLSKWIEVKGKPVKGSPRKRVVSLLSQRLTL